LLNLFLFEVFQAPLQVLVLIAFDFVKKLLLIAKSFRIISLFQILGDRPFAFSIESDSLLKENLEWKVRLAQYESWNKTKTVDELNKPLYTAPLLKFLNQ